MIIGKRVRLRAIEKADLPRFVTWLNDPEVNEHLLIIAPLSLGSEEKWYENMMQRPPHEQPLAIEVKDGEDWVHVGNTGLHNHDWTNRSAEFGIFIGEKRFWNQGVGLETALLTLHYGFDVLNLNRIFLVVDATNLRGIRCYEKAGYVHEGRMRQAKYSNGKYVDWLLMSVLRSEWEQSHPTG
jgi:diamine N-acetyltransferase